MVDGNFSCWDGEIWGGFRPALDLLLLPLLQFLGLQLPSTLQSCFWFPALDGLPRGQVLYAEELGALSADWVSVGL